VHGLASTNRHDEYILCLGPEATATFEVPNGRWRMVSSRVPSATRAARLVLEQTWLPNVASRLKVDVIHSAGYTSPLVSDGARVTSVHDMNYRAHPEDLSGVERLVYASLLPLVVRRSHRVVAPSHAARADILRWTGTSPVRVAVVPDGVRTAWPGDASTDGLRVARSGITEPFVLSVAASYPHKNLVRLLEAMPFETRSRSRVTLVVVGLKGRAHEEVTAFSKRHPQLVKVLGWVDDALLASLYRRAAALAFPSLYEGFGLPILEAMGLGTPVVTSAIGAMAEIADNAAELVDPYDVQSIRRGVQRVLTDRDYAQALRRRGLARAAEFTWERTARETQGIYAAALGSYNRVHS
jgi:glycosyltransferase involved in cell wall biosynthesis